MSDLYDPSQPTDPSLPDDATPDDDPVSRVRHVFGAPRETFAEVEIPPRSGFVVHHVASTPQNAGIVWAWCESVEGKPGYASIVFTGPDGATPADPHPGNPDRALRLGEVLFRVWC